MVFDAHRLGSIVKEGVVEMSPCVDCLVTTFLGFCAPMVGASP
jgi:hypothetical protein